MFRLVQAEYVWKDILGDEGEEVGHSHAVEYRDTYVSLSGDT